MAREPKNPGEGEQPQVDADFFEATLYPDIDLDQLPKRVRRTDDQPEGPVAQAWQSAAPDVARTSSSPTEIHPDDKRPLGIASDITSKLSEAEIFKKADMEVVWFNRVKGYGFVVEKGKDPHDKSNHIQIHMNALRTYPFPGIEEGIEQGEYLRGIVYWKNPGTGKTI